MQGNNQKGTIFTPKILKENIKQLEYIYKNKYKNDKESKDRIRESVFTIIDRYITTAILNFSVKFEELFDFIDYTYSEYEKFLDKDKIKLHKFITIFNSIEAIVDAFSTIKYMSNTSEEIKKLFINDKYDNNFKDLTSVSKLIEKYLKKHGIDINVIEDEQMKRVIQGRILGVILSSLIHGYYGLKDAYPTFKEKNAIEFLTEKLITTWKSITGLKTIPKDEEANFYSLVFEVVATKQAENEYYKIQELEKQMFKKKRDEQIAQLKKDCKRLGIKLKYGEDKDPEIMKKLIKEKLDKKIVN